MNKKKKMMVSKWSKSSFYKVSATGNDFIVVDLRKNESQKKWEYDFKKKSRNEIAKMLCHRREGMGADGLVFLENANSKCNLKWDFYNSDGSKPDMCGNAIRGVAAFCRLIDKSQKLKSITIQTIKGPVTGRHLTGNYFEADLNFPRILKRNIKLNINNENLILDLINTGVPHAVIKLGSLNKISNREVARYVRNDNRFSPHGVNVTFYHQINPEQIKTVTYERGVENFTRSCGTGVVAAAFRNINLNCENDGVVNRVITPGGIFKVVFLPSRRLVKISGQVNIIWQGKWKL